ncbi:hypothetical protein HDU96_003763 [Phlyctochytrium bullatum]|nr:hypothetical protein HDU96_003763 [Phlyctochytrium bullatum]
MAEAGTGVRNEDIGLLEGGFRKVGLMVSDGPYLPVLHIAIIMMRPAAAIIPLDRTDPRLHLILDDAAPELILLDEDPHSTYYPFPQTTRSGTSASDRLVLEDALSRLEDPKRRELVKSAKVVTMQEMMNASKGEREEDGLKESARALEAEGFAEEDVSHVYFTSGSTGRPKGCVSTLGALTSYIHAKNTSHDVTPSSVVFLASSHTFDPSLGDFCATLAAGAVLAMSPRPSLLANLGRCLDVTSATHVLTTPVLFGTVKPQDVTSTEPEAYTCSTLRVVALGGELMPTEIVERWAGRVKLINTYGTTECAVYQTAAVVEAVGGESWKVAEGALGIPGSRKDIGGPIGKCGIHMMRLRQQKERRGLVNGRPDEDEVDDSIADAEMDNLCLADDTEIGEIWISGPQVGLGYLRRSELTAKRFITHPELGKCFRTGDLACWVTSSNQNGLKRRGLIYLGRSDTQIKVSGRRVEVEEVESVLHKLTAPTLVSSLAVVLNKSSKILVAYCVPSPATALLGMSDGDNANPSTSENGAPRSPAKTHRLVVAQYLKTVALRSLPRHMVPARFEFMEKLPQTATGKVGRAALSAQELVFSFDDIDEDEGVEDGLDESSGENTLSYYINLVADAWREHLALPKEGDAGGFKILPSMGFDELGGDSIKALLVSKTLSAKLRHPAGKEADGSGGAKSPASGKKGIAAAAGESSSGLELFVEGNIEPAEILKRPRLVDFARYIRDEMASHAPEKSMPENIGLKKGRAVKLSPEEDYVADLRALLYRASGMGTTTVVESIIADIHILDANGRFRTSASTNTVRGAAAPAFTPQATITPLHCACLNGHLGTAMALIRLGASVSSRDARGVLPLHLAAHKGPLELVDALLSASIAVGTASGSTSRIDPLLLSDDDGQIALHHAARSGAPESVIRRLATWSATGAGGASGGGAGGRKKQSGTSGGKHGGAVFSSTALADEATVRRRLEARDKGGRTPLLWAAMNGHRGAVKELVDLGADTGARSAAGEDAVMIAERLARCGAQERGAGVRSSVFGDIARLVGGRGTTKNVSKYIEK